MAKTHNDLIDIREMLEAIYGSVQFVPLLIDFIPPCPDHLRNIYIY